MPEKVIRFGITDGQGHRAASWKLWTPSRASDVYLACRELGGTLKVSLHETGNWHVAYSQTTFDADVYGIVPSQKDRFMDTWTRPKPIAPGVTIAFRIVTPYSAVTTPLYKPGKNITWIPNCPSPCAIEIDIILVSPTTPVTGWPGKNKTGTQFIGSYDLSNGDSVWAVYWIIDMPNLASATQGVGSFYRGRSKEDLKSGNLRAFVFGNEPDGSRVIYDCAVSTKGS